MRYHLIRYFPAKSQKLKMETKSSGREAKEGTHVFQGWAVMYFITGARHFPVSSLDLKDLRYKIWTKYVCRIQTLKVLRTLYNKYKELEAVWYKVWVKWMIILVGETVTWPLPEQIMERSSPKNKYIASELCTLIIENPVHRFKYAIWVITTAEVAEMHIKTFSLLFCFN